MSFSSIVADDWSFEVICIDDGSVDDTINILKRFSRAYNNFQIIEFGENKGMSIARNRGIKQASGDYIWFVDSDDSVATESVPSLLAEINTHHCDVACFNYHDVDETGNIFRSYSLFDDSFDHDGISFASAVLGTKFSLLTGYAWRFIYRKEFLEARSLYFPEGECWEDTVFVPKAILLSSSVLSSSAFCYKYTHNSLSVSNSFKRSYTGKLLYEFIFCAGAELYEFGSGFSDNHISETLTSVAKREYFNKLPVYLCRQPKEQRREFFEFVRENTEHVKRYWKIMPILTKMTLMPLWGESFSNLLSYIYNMCVH